MTSSDSASESGKPEGANKYSYINVTEIGKHFSASAAAVCVGQGAIHPIDVVKVRLQLEHVGQRASSSGMAKKLLHIVRHEGVQSLYQGLTPALWRACVYGCLRLGLYEPCKDALDWAFHSSNLLTKMGAGVLSGATATIASHPIDVLKVRRQAQHQPLRGAMVREFRNIVAVEGVGGLWRGVGPSTARASVLTASQLATYDESKQIIRHWVGMEEGFWMQISLGRINAVQV